MIEKLEAFFEATNKENILDDDLYRFTKEHSVPLEVALLMQIIRELKNVVDANHS